MDAAVIGGGIAGLTLSLMLANSGLRTACIDRADLKESAKADKDGRTIAISYGSRQILEKAGVWEFLAPQACPIETIHITENGGPVLLNFDSAEAQADAFGWIVDISLLRRVLIEAGEKAEGLEILAPMEVKRREKRETRNEKEDQITLSLLASGNSLLEQTVRLLVGADGRRSQIREMAGIDTISRDYRQRAIVCAVIHENSHDNIAVEDFRAEGPLAILPMNDDEAGNHRSSVVWTEHARKKTSAANYEEETFNAALNARFPERYGRVKLAGKRFSYLLNLVHAKTYIGDRLALVADAAHGIHPIAGQGLNIGLRDVDALADLVGEAHREGRDIGGAELLMKYQRARRFDNTAMAAATDILNGLFANDFMPVSLARRTGLRMISRLPPAKRFFMRQAMGASKR